MTRRKAEFEEDTLVTTWERTLIMMYLKITRGRTKFKQEQDEQGNFGTNVTVICVFYAVLFFI